MLDVKVFLNDKLLRKTTLAKNRITVGRSEHNDIVLSDPLVSRLHAVIEKRGGRYLLEDHSTNGTYLDTVRVEDVQPMEDECDVGIYPFTLRFNVFSDEVTKPLIESSPSEKMEEPEFMPPEADLRNLHFGLLVGEDPLMHRLYKTIERVADSSASVLIRGESGTGKELVARAIHSLSPRRSAPFVALDCAAIPDSLIESELFGFEKGAFTGASALKKGWFEQAQGGTIFLDEIGELSISAQAKLLRFLQDKSFSHLGGTRVLVSDIRLITATNKDLEEAIRTGQFRSDLYFRLHVVQIELPPLRDRKGDIPLLIDHVLSKIEREHKLSQRPIPTPKAIEKLRTYHWPGNVRQLENTLYNAFITTSPPHLIDDKDLEIRADIDTPSKSFDEINRQLLIETLKGCNWDTAKAANVLKVSRGSIYYKCKKLGINIKQLSKP
ncbi:MAG TPA: sigma 54-interacting transcriptional regulator [Nitrospiria bacterium]|nr:sigma 54-interacting transcriptional regulator [Nitrospiria bacterium]HUK56125.1 sigma 54-interacting transcriptional regulator [Nitrospiria bacterium]